MLQLRCDGIWFHFDRLPTVLSKRTGQCANKHISSHGHVHVALVLEDNFRSASM